MKKGQTDTDYNKKHSGQQNRGNSSCGYRTGWLSRLCWHVSNRNKYKKGNKRSATVAKKDSFFIKQHGLCSFISAFFCCVVIFGGVVAVMLHYLTPSLKPSVTPGYSSTAAVSSPSVSYSASGTFTMLVSVYSDSNGAPVMFMLYRLDTTNNRTVIMPIPLNLAVNFQSAVCSLSNVYKSGGISDASIAIKRLLQVKIDYTCNIGSGNFLKIFDKLGGLYGIVPENLTFTMPGSSSALDLSASPNQYLGGAKIYALISCTSYSNATLRYSEQSSLMKEFITEKFAESYINNTGNYYGDIFNYVSTDFSMNELLKRADAIKALSSSKSIVSPQPLYTALNTGSELLQFENTATVKKYFS